MRFAGAGWLIALLVLSYAALGAFSIVLYGGGLDAYAGSLLGAGVLLAVAFGTAWASARRG